MKIIETNGISWIEELGSSREWHWGTNYTSGDLYEAEEIFLSGKKFEPNRLIFVHYPDGTVYEPIDSKENQYFGRPAYIDGEIYILLVNFEEKYIRIVQWLFETKEIITLAEIPLSEVKDCYNLLLDGSPIMLTRSDHDNHFQIIWPEKVDICIEDREGFVVREDEKLFFSVWHEDPEYREEVYVREYPSGNLIEKIPGGILTMPDKQNWVLR